MSFDQDPNEQANISGADLAIMVDEIKRMKAERSELIAALREAGDFFDLVGYPASAARITEFLNRMEGKS